MIEPSTTEGIPASAPLGANLAARLDRLPVIRPHMIWIAILTLNAAMDYYDFTLFNFLIPSIQKDTGITIGEVGWIITAFFVGMGIGALIGGRLLDRFGRRRILILATVVYSLGAVATGLASNFELILVARLLTGIGVQAATSAVLVYIAEMFPTKSRGKFVSAVTISWVVVGPVVSLLALNFIPQGGPGAWRVLFVASGLGLLLIPLTRFLMPESARWLESRGQFEKAGKIVEWLEVRALRRGPLAQLQIAPAAVQELSLRQILRNKRILGTITVVSLGWFGANIAKMVGNYSTLVLNKDLKFDATTTYSISLIASLVYIVTPFLTMLVIDRMERKTLLLWTSILTLVPLIVFGFFTGEWVITAAWSAYGVLVGIIPTVYYAYIPEAMPTEARGMGTGIIFTMGRIGASLSGVLGAMIYSSGRGPLVIAGAVGFVLFAVVVFAWGPRTTGRSLERITADELEVATVPAGRP